MILALNSRSPGIVACNTIGRQRRELDRRSARWPPRPGGGGFAHAGIAPI